MNPKLFPSLIMCLQVGAAVVCFLHKDYRRTIYWLAATALIASVTF